MCHIQRQKMSIIRKRHFCTPSKAITTPTLLLTLCGLLESSSSFSEQGLSYLLSPPYSIHQKYWVMGDSCHPLFIRLAEPSAAPIPPAKFALKLLASRFGFVQAHSTFLYQRLDIILPLHLTTTTAFSTNHEILDQ